MKNMKTNIEKIAVMQAFVDGKRIESSRHGEIWDEIKNPCWNWQEYDYRVVREPKLRPWKPEEVPVGALYKCAGGVSVILASHDNKMFFTNSRGEITYNILDHAAFRGGLFSTDGGKTWQPCGVLE